MVEKSTRCYTIRFLELSGEINPDERRIKQCQVKWWKNIRGSDDNGYQLTREGYQLASNTLDFVFHTFELKNMVTFEFLLKLDKRIRAPWHMVSYGEISIMESYVTTQIILLDGNFSEFWRIANY